MTGAVTEVLERIAPPDVTVVTGAAGWLGRALVHHLTRSGGDDRPGTVRALVTTAADAEALALVSGVEPVVGDVRRPDGLTGLFAGLRGTVDVVHAAGVIHPRASTTSRRSTPAARRT